MKIVATNRLILRHLNTQDAAFIFGLVNQPSWLRHIGDKGVETIPDAEAYIQNGPVKMYHRLGIGLYLVELRADKNPIGICGLIKRDTLDDVDIGFAFLPEYWGKGYAFESATAVMQYAKQKLGLSRVVAITTPDNQPSIKLLEKLEFHYERMIESADDGKELSLFAYP